MVNEVILVGKVAYDPIFYETKEERIGKITILITTLRGNRTEYEKFECYGKAEDLQKFKQKDSVVVYGKLKNDNGLKIIITKIKGEDYEYIKVGN